MKVWVIKEEPISIIKPPMEDQPSRSIDPDRSSLRRFLPALFFIGAAMILWWAMTHPSPEAPKHIAPSQPPQKTVIPSPAAAPRTGVNRPPEILSLEVTPQKPYPGDRLEASVEALDPDGDLIFLSYTWRVNGEIVVTGADPEFPGDILHKHDRVVVQVIPFDGTASGLEARSRSIVIANQPPMIVSTPSTTVQEGVYTYAVKALDPDGDPLLFRLTQAPSDMTIESETGLIRWEVPSEFQSAEVGVAASDGDGAEAFQKFRLFLHQ